MDKKIGKVIFCIALFYAAIVESSLRVMITDVYDNQVEQVEVGVPFIVKVTASNVDYQSPPKGFDQWPHISVSFAGTSQSTRIVNGNKSQSVMFQYIATAEKKGKFACPSLTIKDQAGKIIQSNPVEIIVSDITKTIDYQNSAKPYVLQLQLDQKNVYLGQKISALLRFGYQQDFSNLQLSQEPMEFFHQGYVQTQPTNSSFELNGQTYKSQDFLIELYPERIGTLTIPMCRAVFIPDMSYQRATSLFSMMMSGNSVIESLPRSVQVQALPETDYPNVTAIGTFDSLQFSLSAQTGKIGEGLVAKMKITGSGNLEVVKAPALQLPEGLQYYEGNSNVVRDSDKKSTKEFEWIIQAEHAGSFDIASQQFVYFDPKSEQYHVLESTPTQLTIAGVAEQISKSAEEFVQPTESKVEAEKEAESINNEINSVTMLEKIKNISSSAYEFVQQKILSRKGTIKIVEWFVLLILLIAILFGIRRFVQRSFFVKTFSIRMQFARSCCNKDMYSVYQLFEKLMYQYGLTFDSPKLEECFVKLNMPEESFQNWKNFVTMIWEINFAKDRATDQQDLAFSLAKDWFSVILSCCKLQSKKINITQTNLVDRND